MSLDEPQIIEREVPNPAYEDLEDLLTAVRQAKSFHADDLRSASRLMGEGVWRGPTAARAFAAELEGRDGDLPGHFDELIDAVEARMTEVPQTRTTYVRVW